MTEGVDQDDVLWARNVLLGTERPSPRRAVDACRVLARVSPATYLPRLSKALYELAFVAELREKPEIRLTLFEEAVEAAYAMDETDPQRADVLLSSLDWQQRELFGLGRRPEGLAVCEEMARVSRRAVDAGAPEAGGLYAWARALAEEGRHGEAAALYEEFARRSRPRGPQGGGTAWVFIEWGAEAEAAGLGAAAVEAARELVALQREDLAGRNASLALLLFALVRLAEVLDGQGESEEASAALAEAGELYAELASHGDPHSAGSYRYTFWAVLFGLTGRAEEPAAPGRPAPPFGSEALHWARDVRERYFAGLPALETALTEPACDDDLAERIRRHRRLTVRATLHAQHRHGYRFLESVRPHFEEGVALARRLHALDPAAGAAPLARALFDRAGALTTDHHFAAAQSDFEEARALRAALR
ncbi:hypothetical protein AB0I00_27175 [Streptomyces sp. NPDC050803]|uniref:hypothetical protein n=1 Tax=unclassified Streptomyces TaxID=2593676 RepID=UPI003447F287